jgi:hypothetical protein
MGQKRQFLAGATTHPTAPSVPKTDIFTSSIREEKGSQKNNSPPKEESNSSTGTTKINFLPSSNKARHLCTSGPH